MLVEEDVYLSGLSVQQNDGNDEFDIMPIVTVKELLTLTWENRS